MDGLADKTPQPEAGDRAGRALDAFFTNYIHELSERHGVPEEQPES